MRLAYDPATDSLYIHLSERTSVDSNEVADGVVLDFDAEGTLVGIDLQHASKRADIERLIVSRLPFHELEAA
jgi:uncharacterized protein YuzE